MVLLNDGKVGGKRVISPTGMAFMLRRNSIQLSSREVISYGLGIFIDEKRGYRTFWHDGSMAGYTASMLLVPKQKIAVLIMSNTDSVVLEKTRDKALEIMINPAPAPKTPPAAAKPLAAGEMAKYTGKYSQPKRFDIEVFIKDGKLFIKEFGHELPLTFLGNNRLASSCRAPTVPRRSSFCRRPLRIPAFCTKMFGRLRRLIRFLAQFLRNRL